MIAAPIVSTVRPSLHLNVQFIIIIISLYFIYIYCDNDRSRTTDRRSVRTNVDRRRMNYKKSKTIATSLQTTYHTSCSFRSLPSFRFAGLSGYVHAIAKMNDFLFPWRYCQKIPSSSSKSSAHPRTHIRPPTIQDHFGRCFLPPPVPDAIKGPAEV
jgi:hypothetical protein